MQTLKSDCQINTFERLIATLVPLIILFVFCPLIHGATPARDNFHLKQSQIYQAEKRLADLGYWLQKVDGVADASTRHALIAFQKAEGRKRTGAITSNELEALNAAARPAAKYPGAEHVEIDITRQVLFLVDSNGAVTRILPVSTGSEAKYFEEGAWQIAHTPRGSFKITRQIDGVRHAPLGTMYYPSYFYGGVAIHGINSVPVRPASHGCVRIPRFAAQEFLKLVSVGMIVIVYD